jgi:hypothetical protein
MYQQSPIISGGVIPIEKRVLRIWTKQGIKRTVRYIDKAAIEIPANVETTGA